MEGTEYTNTIGNQLAYDLRQRYAKIVGDHMEDVAEARKAKNYPDYFNALEDLYTITKHKFKGVKKEKKASKDNKENKETYESLRDALCKLSNDHPQSWNGNSKDSIQVGKIESALRAIEMYLYENMNDAGMFGTKRDQQGLL
jgi:hypothetical protein